MDWLNYHHLLYFWTAASEGSLTAAAARLHLSQATISVQISNLERALGAKLFSREGRRLRLTDTGQIVFRYADDIFTLGQELLDTVRGRPIGKPMQLHVGVADVVPKLVAYRLLLPALSGPERVRLVCLEGKPDQLLARLALHELDVVVSDAPIAANIHVRAFNHLLGDSGVSIFATKQLQSRLRGRFPNSLAHSPWLLPTRNTALRRSLDHWFDTHGIRPDNIAEFEDSALLKVFGHQGKGYFPGPTVIEREICGQYDVVVVGQIPTIREQFYAISVERRVRHPGVAAITEMAAKRLFRTIQT